MLYSSSGTVNSNHTAMIHDLKFDYYAKKYATCASDGFVHIFDAVENTKISSFKISESPVWSIDWAHPRFGNILAFSSFDGEVSIWKEHNQWQKVISNTIHDGASVNCVAWCSQQYGLILASCCQDGTVGLFGRVKNDEWQKLAKFVAHESSINSISWDKQEKRFATASSDKSIKLWGEVGGHFVEIGKLEKHKELVRDVQWHPLGENIVSGSEDGTLIIWTLRKEGDEVIGEVLQEIQLKTPIWKISYSLVGNQISVSMTSEQGEGQIAILQEDEEGVYQIIQNDVDKQ